VAARSKAWVCGRSLAGIGGSNPAGDIDVCQLWIVLPGRGLCVGLITRPEESYRTWGVWVWSWSLDNEEVLAHEGLLRHGREAIRTSYRAGLQYCISSCRQYQRPKQWGDVTPISLAGRITKYFKRSTFFSTANLKGDRRNWNSPVQSAISIRQIHIIVHYHCFCLHCNLRAGGGGDYKSVEYEQL
jgi:hypothetical protein